MAYWWCLEHKTVEEGLGCASSSRIGPYDTPDKAAGALARTKAREDEQSAKDKAIEKRWGPKKEWF